MATLTSKLLNRAEFKWVPTDSVQFDPKNPRLGANSSTKQERLQEILMEEPHFANLLVESFVQNGFIDYEPLVVRQASGHFVVIEGNRRLAAVKHIIANSHQYPAAVVKKLMEVPVLIFHQSADASHLKDIRTFLGVHHLLGLKEWPAESKAIFLDQNIKSKGDLKRIRDEFAISVHDIQRYLIPYRVKKVAASILEDLDFTDDKSFWVLGEALTRRGIKEYIELDVEPGSYKIRGFNKLKLEYLIEFLYGTTRTSSKSGNRVAAGMRRITDTRQLKRLADVLANKRSSKKLEEGSTLEEAELYIATPEETIDGLIAELTIMLQRIIALRPSDEQIKELDSSFKSFDKAVKSL